MTRLILIVLFASGPLFAQTAQAPQLPTGPQLPKVGVPAPEFAFADVIQGDGSPAGLTPAALRGRVVVLDFFATWCAPCVAAIPRTNALVDEFKNEPVSFLAVANESRTVLETFLSTHPMSARLVLDDRDKTYGNYWVRSLPFVVVVDTTGQISAFASPATLSSEQIRSALKR